MVGPSTEFKVSVLTEQKVLGSMHKDFRSFAATQPT